MCSKIPPTNTDRSQPLFFMRDRIVLQRNQGNVKELTSSSSQSLWTLIQLILYRLIKRGMLSASLYTCRSMESIIPTLPEIPAQEKELIDYRRSPSARRAPTTNRKVVNSLDVLPSQRPTSQKSVISPNNLLSHDSRPESRTVGISTNRHILA